MSSSGDPITKLRARFIHVLQSARKLFGHSCGVDLCQDKRMDGRFVHIRDGRKVFAVASECCQPPLDGRDVPGRIDEENYDPEQYYTALATKPFIVEGLSRVIQVKTRALLRCSEYDCLYSYLYYYSAADIASGSGVPGVPCGGPPEGNGIWYGKIGNVELFLWVDLTADPEQRIQLCLGGCYGDGEGGPIGPFGYAFGCNIKLNLVAEPGEISLRGCCDRECATTGEQYFNLEFALRTFCAPRRIGRFVAVAPRTLFDPPRKVFALTDCCEKVECERFPQACCLELMGCDLVASIPSGELAGSYTLKPEDMGLGSLPYGWATDPFSACGRLWIIRVTCTEEDKFFIQIESQEEGCPCFTSTPAEAPITSCFPLIAEANVNVTCPTDERPECQCDPVTVPIVITA